MTITTNKVTLNEERNVTLVTMVQTVTGELNVGKRPGIVILPGGGYTMCSDREAEVVAYPYLAAGYHAFVLRYSVAEHRTWPNPLNDWEQAMEYILSHADEWGLATDKIAVVGFSAGGHLAATVATCAKHRPNAALLGYAALNRALTDAMHRVSPAPVPTECVDAKTPPCFIFACCDDPIVPMCNPVGFMEQLNKYSITYECHIYPYGSHGFGTAEYQLAGDTVCPRVRNWVSDSIGFLNDIFGKLSPKGLEEPVCAGKLNGNTDDYLSIDCTFGYLREQKAADEVMAPITSFLDKMAETQYGNAEIAKSVFGTFKLKDILALLQKTDEEKAAINKALAAIPNVR